MKIIILGILVFFGLVLTSITNERNKQRLFENCEKKVQFFKGDIVTNKVARFQVIECGCAINRESYGFRSDYPDCYVTNSEGKTVLMDSAVLSKGETNE